MSFAKCTVCAHRSIDLFFLLFPIYYFIFIGKRRQNKDCSTFFFSHSNHFIPITRFVFSSLFGRMHSKLPFNQLFAHSTFSFIILNCVFCFSFFIFCILEMCVRLHIRLTCYIYIYAADNNNNNGLRDMLFR